MAGQAFGMALGKGGADTIIKALVAAIVTLLLVGLLWIVVFYISQGRWPVAAFNYWNLVVGFSLLIAGFGMTMKWK